MKRIARGAIAGLASAAITFATLVVLAELNAAPESDAHAHALVADRVVPVAPRPEPDPEDALEAAALATAAPSPAASTKASIDPPTPSAPSIAGVSPTAGPGSLPLALAAGDLPSVAGLPSAALEHAAVLEPDTPARVTHRPAPAYPALAQRRGVEGFVTLRLRIDARGRVADAVVIESDPPNTFDETALRTARSYRFTPARHGGEAVGTTVQQTIRFELE